MTEQKTCIMCKSASLETLFPINKRIFQGCYPVPTPTHPCYDMPFNITSCNNCKTHQLKYFGDLSIIYDYQAGFYGSIRSSMNDLFAKFVATNSNINAILEVGAGHGALAQNILAQKQVPYSVADPTYTGPETNITVYRTFFEELDTTHLTNINTIVMSHIFEHFYDPIAILQKIKASPVQYCYLNFPDLERFVKEDNYQVLTPEHIYYIETNFLIQLFAYYGFELKNRYDHEKHSIFLEFHRSNTFLQIPFPINHTSQEDIHGYLTRLEDKINKICTMSDPIYIWPSSMHTIYLLAFNLPLEKIKAFIDNAPHKIGQYLYGTGKKIIPFSEVPKGATVILNGGCFNVELKDF